MDFEQLEDLDVLVEQAEVRILEENRGKDVSQVALENYEYLKKLVPTVEDMREFTGGWLK